MNITNRITHDVQQGTGPWLRLREGYFTASEAPAALGVSLYVTRAELLRRKFTGVTPDPDAATLGRFEAGHAAEARARPLAEQEAGGDLFPVTMTAEVDGLRLLASLDGLTMDDEIAWETKLWNEGLAAAVRAGNLPDHYTVQMDQELLVSGASRCLFTCTDGTPERYVSCWYEADPAKFAVLLDGWRRFAADLSNYTPPAAADPAPVGRAPETLPALRIELTGQVTASNLAEFKATALGAIRAVNRTLKTDQDFADAEKAVKWCADVEARLKAAKEHALSQTSSIDELFRALDEIAAESKAARLDLDKLVTRRKTEVKEEAVAAARAALDLHIAAVNAEIAPMRLLPQAVDFAGAIKGKRSIDSMQDALDTLLAGAKIAADAQGRAIRANVQAFNAATGGDTALQALFADLLQLVHKPAEDFGTLVDARIAKHRADQAERERVAEQKRLADIAAAEERARQQERDKLAAEQAAAAEAERRKTLEREQESIKTAGNIMGALPGLVQHGVMESAQAERVTSILASLTADAAAGAAKAKAAEPATLKLGVICERLGFTVTAAFLQDALHIKAADTAGRAVLYRESQWPTICAQLRSHIGAVEELYMQQEAS